MYRCAVGHVTEAGVEQTLVPTVVREVLKPDGFGIKTETVREEPFCPEHLASVPEPRVVTIAEQEEQLRKLAKTGLLPQEDFNEDKSDESQSDSL